METLEFGQRQSIHVAIRQLIHDYPQDEGILKELIQNADDGGASQIHFILDRRSFKGIEGPVPDWEWFGRPALVVTNDRPFDAQDLKNIQELNNSDKIQRPNQTGRYGRGFNAVYNLTDTPLLLTGEHVSLFDPCSFHVEQGKSGRGWKLSDPDWVKKFPDALRIFESGGLAGSRDSHEGTIFRFPLRQELRGKSAEEQITNQLFEPEKFYKLVDGLEKLAGQILLYLKSLKFVGCYEIGPNGGDPVPLLEIETLNIEVVSRGRGSVLEEFDDTQGLDEVLDVISEFEDGRKESVFRHELEIRCPGKQKTTCTWLVCSGVYAGPDKSLIALARQLNHSGNKALPYAGAAVCLEKNGKRLPGVQGEVSCFLPLAEVLGGTKLGFSINGAFDLDGSRTGITKHKGGEFGITESRAEWNVRLLQEGVVPAITRALASIELETDDDSARFYRLFPESGQTLPDPFGALVEGFYRAIATEEVFRVADGSTVALARVRLVPPDEELELALTIEGLPIPTPRLPHPIAAGFTSAGINLSELDPAEVVDVYLQDECKEWSLDEIELASLSDQSRVEAVVRFLVEKDWKEWRMLPLAVCEDGYLRTFPEEEKGDLYAATDRQLAIFDWFPQWFLNRDFCNRTGLQHCEGDGYETMSLLAVLQKLPSMIFHSETRESCWNPTGDESPNAGWLVSVYDELLEEVSTLKTKEVHAQLQKTPIVPGDDETLHPPGSQRTPLLVPHSQSKLSSFLKDLDVRHFVLNPQNPLTKPLNRFKNEVEMVWSLSPGGLVDSLASNLTKLVAGVDSWRTPEVVSRLVKFLSGLDADVDEGRQGTLRALPIWEDTMGGLGPVDGNSYLQGEFDPPEIAGAIRVLIGGAQADLLETLGVVPISRSELLTEHLIGKLSAFDDDTFLKVTRWIRDEWNHLCSEIGEGEPELIELLQEEDLVLVGPGDQACASDLYLSDKAEFAKEVLGSAVRTPSAELYSAEAGLWQTFFENLGILASPSAQHLVDFIEGIVDECEEELPQPEQEKALIKILAHLRVHLEELAEEEVDTEALGSVEFEEFIGQTAWVPAYRSADGVDRFGAWEEPDRRLFQPKELVHFNLGARCASTRPLSPRGVREFPPELRTKLGIIRLPSPEEVCGHLKNVVERVGGEILSEEVCGKISKPLEEIYRGLGELAREAEKDDTGASLGALVAACESVHDLPCLLDVRQPRLMLPHNVYGAGAARMAPLKVSMKGGTPEIDRGMELLGRIERPGVEDLAATLREIFLDERSLDEEEFEAALTCVSRIITLHREDPGAERPVLALPNQAGEFRDPADLVVPNDTVLADQLTISDELLLHHRVPLGILEVIKVPTLASANATVCGELTPTGDAEIADRCLRIQELLRSAEFTQGLERLLHRDGRPIHLMELRWLREVRVSDCETLLCSYQLDLPGERNLSLGNAECEIAFADVGPGGEFFVSAKAFEGGLLETHFGRELLKQLDRNAPPDTSELLSLLKGTPDDVHRMLDLLHVPQLGTGKLVDEDDTEVAVFGGADEESESENEAGVDGGEGREPFDEESGPSSEEGEQPTEGPGIDSQESIGEQDLGEQDRDEAGESSETGDGEQTHPASEGDGERHESSGDHEGDKGEGTGSGTRHAGMRKEGTKRKNSRRSQDRGKSGGGKRGRMTKGDESTKQEAKRVQKTSRQQDGFWISRPKTEKQADAERRKGDSHNDEDEEGRNLAIGDMAVGWVLQFEHSKGRKPMSMAHANPGYDVESKKGRFVERYIEVKGIDGEWGQNGVPLSSIQFEYAVEKGDAFWLYVVEHARDPGRVKIYMIQNPAGKATEFRFDHGWAHAGKSADGFQPRLPEKGRKLRKILDEGGFEDGEIISVENSGKLTMLEVRFDSAPSRRFTYDPTRHLVLG